MLLEELDQCVTLGLEQLILASKPLIDFVLVHHKTVRVHMGMGRHEIFLATLFRRRRG